MIVLGVLLKPPVCANGKAKQLPVFGEMKPKPRAMPLSVSSVRRRDIYSETEMASVKKVSVLVAASVGAVEALKDQAGLCRWNYGLRSLQQRAKRNMGSLSQAAAMSSSVSDRRSREQAERSEESLRKVMYISCWGPN
ncbi:hypothetical protein ZIOFF_029121 [Zingiber officinale]|uniref:Wound-responsive family protein n=2 Tax=Zingiber officinale TaxID=94328 RepID=A0A8J5GP15_ZINOF|nr:hypothetical protein ZIOFF_029121 [Zingiber officinale]